ncbi:hypothetical protein AEQ67_28395 [Pseudomonas sp. RIT-PI-q]|uniref:hypothetical protein n=1 Tax=Pseudomonas sp. RIT-PI-q TaxID=1690247 RepID=UPI0006CC2E68|nr:hypothetical protein [Pseudomonas sp. RIT-PI-q]KPG91903.1 hypothetical protein AEQ67_28395 [Pseudomonas sp. RIT-PI-q]
MKKSGRSLVEQSALQSVIDNARRSAEAGYPDFAADDPATFDADFIVQREREGMSLTSALEALVAFKRAQR